MKLRRKVIPYLFIAPALVGLTVFRIYPILSALHSSLYDFSLIGRTRTFVGLANYVGMLHDTLFWKCLWNTGVFAVGATAAQVILSLLVAVAAASEIKGITFFRSLLFIPVVTSMVVAGTIWKLAYNADYGLINAVLRSVGVPAQPFLLSSRQALPAVMAMVVWKGVGYWMSIFVAGLKAIPMELYEAARIDGGNALQRFFRITLPLLKRSIAFVVVADTIINLLLFSPVYLMTRGGPSNSTTVLMYYTFKNAFVFSRMGYATALSCVLLVMALLIVAIQLRLFRAEFRY